MKVKPSAYLCLTLVCMLSVLGGIGTAWAKKTTITVMSWQLNETEQTQAWFRRAKEVFESQHPSVEVELTTANWGEEYRQKVLVGTVGGAAPDVVHLSIVWGRNLYELGALLPLNEYIARDREAIALDDFVPITQQYNQKDGIYFGVTSAMDEAALIYNIDLLEKAGLDTDPDAMASWEDFRTYAQRLTRTHGNETIQWGYAGGFGVEVFNSFLVANGGSFYDSVGLTGFNSRQGIETGQFLQKLYSEYRCLGGNFINRTAAMMHGGNWVPYQLQQQTPDMRFVLTSYPQGPSGSSRGTTTWGHMYSITSSTKHPDLAWEFVRYYTSLEANVEMFQMLNYVASPRMSFYKTKEWRSAIRSYPWMTNIPHIAMAGGVYPYLQYSDMDSQVWNPIVVPALAGERALQPALEQAERLYNQILQAGAQR